MGIFRVEVDVADPVGGTFTFVRAGSLLVDTGSEVTWIHADLLRAAGVAVRKHAQLFRMANGETIARDVGYAVFRADGFETVDEVVFANDDDLQLLGARTLEGFNAVVDPQRRRLVAAGPMPAAAA